jgi:hypothetical protein
MLFKITDFTTSEVKESGIGTPQFTKRRTCHKIKPILEGFGGITFLIEGRLYFVASPPSSS